MAISPDEQKLKALEWFKDWSNYMLVTTVAAIGWIAASKSLSLWHWGALIAFGLSAIFAVLTLAAIPLIAEQVSISTTSIYDVTARYRWRYMSGAATCPIKIKAVCFPQHLFFILGVIAYVVSEMDLGASCVHCTL